MAPAGGRALRAAVVAVALATSGAVAVAAGPPPHAGTGRLELVASDALPGWVGFAIKGHVGGHITIAELTPGLITPFRRLVLRKHVLRLPKAVAWRCDRTVRRFEAIEMLADGADHTAFATVSTPSCAGQLHLATWPQPPRAGARLTVRFSDGLRLPHLHVHVCMAPAAAAGGAADCRLLAVPRSVGMVETVFVPPRPGTWLLTVRGRGGIRLTQTLKAQSGELTLLATGDSEIQVLDDFIASALAGRMHVISEAHISTGLSDPEFFDWLSRASQQVAEYHPDVTVVFIGANDGFDLPTPDGEVSCCGQAWIDAYAARVHQMMADYLRGGAGQVYWFTLPTPRPPSFARTFTAIDAGFALAASQFPEGVHLIDDGPVFAPGGRFEQYISYDGQTVNVREPDGIHLSADGDRIALSLLLAQMRSDGIL